ncbi:hypothetical protein PMSD_27545 [Paenibacillus macquariensis subsp. defensor]|nr:hypothetical protein PMSD_27545 [Paenibacillus macquariensis subsp. defensor]
MVEAIPSFCIIDNLNILSTESFKFFWRDATVFLKYRREMMLSMISARKWTNRIGIDTQKSEAKPE